MSATSKVLLKLFAHRFYKAHAGLLLFFFVTVLISFFFVNVLNQSHLNAEQKIFFQLSLVLDFISSPVFTALILTAWLAYMIKSWSFTRAQLRLPQNHFLFYSLNAPGTRRQLMPWLTVQAVIALPMVIYGVFALLIGLLFDYYLLPVIILLYITMLIIAGAFISMRLTAGFIDSHTVPWLMQITRSWPKPFFSLPLYHLVHRQRVTLAVTKLLSAAILLGGALLLENMATDQRIMGIVALGLATTHAFVIYQAHRFANVYLSFSQNFPYTRTQLFAYAGAGYGLLLLPELAWLLYYGKAVPVAQAVIFIAATLMLFHALLFRNTPTTKKFLYQVFYLFVISFIGILFNMMPVLCLLALIGTVKIQSSKFKVQNS